MRADEPKCGWRTPIVLYYPPLCCKSKQTDGQSDLFMNGDVSPNVIRIYLERRRRSTLFNVLLRGFFSTPYLWTESGERESRVLEYPRTSAANRTETSKGRCANRGKINNVDSCKYSVYICMYIQIYLVFARNYNNIKFNKERIVLLY